MERLIRFLTQILKHSNLPVLACLILIFFQSVRAEPHPPELPLANVYKQGINPGEYWVSEKLDGARAYWDGKQLLSRRGNIYHAPDWFIAGFPAQPLDGELWIARNQFEPLMNIIRDTRPTADWRRVKYMVFDMPMRNTTFTERLEKLDALFAEISSPYIRLIEQFRISDHETLMNKLDEVVEAGGEGLMLHRGDSWYQGGRSNDLLKVKTFQDAEATVIAHLPGKGKYKGMVGALLVETDDNIRFRLGTGFTDQQRRDPPPIGSLVTYKYYGKTVNGLPRFASFLRIRSLPENVKQPAPR